MNVATSCLDLLTLALLPGVGPRTVRTLRTRGPLGEVLAHPDLHDDVLGEAARARLASGEARRRAQGEMETAARLRVTLVGQDDPAFPPLLRAAYDPPAVLYVRGDLQAATAQDVVALAIVGSRGASARGRTLARGMARDLARAGGVVVSGLARGIDTAAHEGALDGGGPTVAVLGSSLDQVYPPENQGLANRIAARGAVVSEFPFGHAPLPGHFPRRNRVIAGMCQATVVVEAAAKSGALITARYALEEGREVMAVPGHPADRGAEGTNALLRDGAALVRGAEDVAQELGMALMAPAPAASNLLLAAFPADSPLSLEDLCRRSGRPAADLVAELSVLELEARIRRLPGALYLRIPPERV
jgi:DNA processing protein